MISMRRVVGHSLVLSVVHSLTHSLASLELKYIPIPSLHSRAPLRSFARFTSALRCARSLARSKAVGKEVCLWNECANFIHIPPIVRPSVMPIWTFWVWTRVYFWRNCGQSNGKPDENDFWENSWTHHSFFFKCACAKACAPTRFLNNHELKSKL